VQSSFTVIRWSEKKMKTEDVAFAKQKLRKPRGRRKKIVKLRKFSILRTSCPDGMTWVSLALRGRKLQPRPLCHTKAHPPPAPFLSLHCSPPRRLPVALRLLSPSLCVVLPPLLPTTGAVGPDRSELQLVPRIPKESTIVVATLQQQTL